MRKKDRPRYPHKAGKAWWYEEKAGIKVYSEEQLHGDLLRWRDLESALNRTKRLRKKIKPRGGEAYAMDESTL